MSDNKLGNALIVNSNTVQQAVEITGRSVEEIEVLLDRAEAKNVICSISIK